MFQDDSDLRFLETPFRTIFDIFVKLPNGRDVVAETMDKYHTLIIPSHRPSHRNNANGLFERVPKVQGELDDIMLGKTVSQTAVVVGFKDAIDGTCTFLQQQLAEYRVVAIALGDIDKPKLDEIAQRNEVVVSAVGQQIRLFGQSVSTDAAICDI